MRSELRRDGIYGDQQAGSMVVHTHPVQRTPTVSATLYSAVLEWRGEPGAIVQGTLLEDGLLKGHAGRSVADSGGTARLAFAPANECRNCVFPQGALLPGNQVVLDASGHGPLTITLPPVAADVEPEGDRLGGIGPRDSRVQVTIWGADRREARLSRDIGVGSGSFVLDVGGQVDLTPSDHGEITYTDAAGNVFRSDIAQPAVAVQIGRPVYCVWHRNERLNVVVTDVDGQVKYTGCVGVDRSVPVVGGDTVELQRGKGFLVPGVVPAIRTVVPVFSIAFDPSSNSLRGLGPANRRLEVETGAAFVAARRWSVVTDSAGVFHVDVPDLPGPAAIVRYDAGNGITVAHHFTQPTVFVGLDNAALATRLGVGSDVAELDMALSDATGDIKAQRHVRAVTVGPWGEQAWSGSWDENYRTGGKVVAQSGDSVQVDLSAGATEAISVTIPTLSGQAHVVDHSVSGVAPANSDVLVTIAGATGAESQVSPLRVRSDGVGRYRAALDGLAELRPGMWGVVAVAEMGSPVVFYSVWDVPQVRLDLDTGSMNGTGVLGDAIRVAVKDGSGATRHEAATTTRNLLSLTGGREPFRAGWSMQLPTRLAGGDLDLVAGDVVEVHGKAGDALLTIPPVDLEADPALDVVRGHTAGDHTVRLHIAAAMTRDPLRAGLAMDTAVAVGPGGDFEQSLGGAFDLVAGDTIAVRLASPAGHEFTRTMPVPYMDVLLDNGWIQGVHASPMPGLPIRGSLTRGGAHFLDVSGQTGTPESGGLFRVALRDDLGAPSLPMAGDHLEVRIGSATTVPLAMDVPDLTAEMDWAGARLHGRVGSPGTMELRIGPNAFLYARPGADGSFDVPITLPGAVEPWAWPGRIAVLRMYLPSGHAIVRRFVFPQLSVEHGGARVEGLAPPLATVAVELIDAGGAVLARGEGRAKEYLTEGWDGDTAGNFVVILRQGGQPVPIEAGQRVRAVVAGLAVDTPVDALRAAPDWARDRLVGEGPPNAQFTWSLQSDRQCWLTEGYSWEPPQDLRTWSANLPLTQDGAGHFTVSPLGLLPGKRLLVGFLTPAGHRVVRTVMRASAAVNAPVGTVEGCGQPLVEVLATVRSEANTLRASGRALADAMGRYALTVQTPSGAPVALQPTDSVEICAAGECSTMPVRFQDLRFDGTQAIAGHAIPGVPAYLTLSPGYPLGARPEYPQVGGGEGAQWYPWVTSLSDGASSDFRVTNDDLRDWRQPWRIADLLAIRLWSEVAEGHYVVSDATPMRPVYLPWLSTAQVRR